MASRDTKQQRFDMQAIIGDILESVNDAVVTIDEEHRVLFCNKAAERMFGYSCEEMLGMDVTPLIPNPHQGLHRGYVDRYLSTGVPRVLGRARECFGQNRDGRTFPVEISYSVSRTEGRLYFTAVIRDITERRELEREIRFMERLADIGKAVAHVVHEIRKPLMLMGGFALQVKDSRALEGSEKERHKLHIVVEEVRRLEKLLNGVRLLTRPPTSSEKLRISVNELVRDTIDLLDPMLQNQRVRVEVSLDPAPLLVLADADQLKQVLLNLLQNAVDAMGGVGTVRVESRLEAERARVTVTDEGPGIPPEARDKVFDPFFTTKSEGSGLGLAISRGIIRDHGGDLVLAPGEKKGTTFVIDLPLDTGS